MEFSCRCHLTTGAIASLALLLVTDGLSVYSVPPLPPDQGPSLADAFEYVMYGKVYRIEGDEGPGDSGRL